MSRLDELRQRYYALAHAMQTGVAYRADKRDQDPKHLRVGINSAMVDHGALVGLLLKKGIITDEEYYEALCEAMKREVDSYRQHLADQWGYPVEKVTLV